MDKDQATVIKEKLTAIEAAEAEHIDSNDFEVMGEDDKGRDGVYTIDIINTVSEALELIMHLEENHDYDREYEGGGDPMADQCA